MRFAAIVLATLLMGGLTGCGDEDPKSTSGTKQTPSATPSAEPTPKPLPKCSTVWVQGEQFPDPYRGCKAAGVDRKAAPLICESGQILYSYGKHFFAVSGAPVVRTKGPFQHDAQYLRVYRACTA